METTTQVAAAVAVTLAVVREEPAAVVMEEIVKLEVVLQTELVIPEAEVVVLVVSSELVGLVLLSFVI
jgi:hypothetical protein